MPGAGGAWGRQRRMGVGSGEAGDGAGLRPVPCPSPMARRAVAPAGDALAARGALSPRGPGSMAPTVPFPLSSRTSGLWGAAALALFTLWCFLYVRFLLARLPCLYGTSVTL